MSDAPDPCEDTPEDLPEDDGERIAALTHALLGIARGTFDDPSPRDGSGDRWDVLSFLVNSTAEEVRVLLADLETERVERDRAHARLVEAEKLAALGLLAAGVAHEMNQPLTVIMALADLLRADPDRSPQKLEEGLAMIVEAARQMGRIVDSVRTYGRAADVQKTVSSALLPLEGATVLLSRSFAERGIELTWNIEDGLPRIQASVDQLRQVFINLLGNAADAVMMPDARGREVVLTISTAEGRIIYRVTDSGPGVPPDVSERLFDPFITTKPVGQGTGLGLSVAMDIVKNHGGKLAHEAPESGGASFIVNLPIAEGLG